MPDSDEILNDFDTGAYSPHVEETPPPPPIFEPFEPVNIRTINFKNIRPRRWVYGQFLLRGFVSCFAGEGGTGKTSLATAIGMSVALGRSVLSIGIEKDHVIHKQGSVFYYNLEDPMEEMEHRLAGELLHRKIDPEELFDKFYLASGRDHSFCVASLDKSGRVVGHDIAPAVALLKRLGIIALIVDPLVNAHALDGNRNDYLAVIIDQFRKIAHEADCAVLIIHHFRKGGQAGDVQSSLGAVTLTNGCRVVETITSMSEDQANALSVEPSKRRRYLCRADAKRNLSAALSEYEWYQFHSVSLGNGDEEYPHGDHVGVLMRWQPTSVASGLDWRKVSNLLDEIDKGLVMEGEYYTSQSNAARWVGQVMMQMLSVPPAQAKALTREWLGSGVLRKVRYDSPQREGKPAQRLVVTPSGREYLRDSMAA